MNFGDLQNNNFGDLQNNKKFNLTWWNGIFKKEAIFDSFWALFNFSGHQYMQIQKVFCDVTQHGKNGLFNPDAA